ncbi:MAG: SUMF1/EgtB/PvdO family nonheme iron enzyme [Bacteroidales bacterium]|nr:SUMF1/EgtB/PvdO family nonheme iron enzyme [Bacteroidales bacterium]
MMGKRFHTFYRSRWLLLCLLLVALSSTAQDETTPKHGDVNSDNEVNIADVNTIIDLILDGASSSATADVNHDGEINIADLNMVIGLILDEQATHIKTYTVGEVSFTMVEVDGGTFMSRHSLQVTLSPFAIGQTEVTQALWVAVMGSNPSYFCEEDNHPGDITRPVERVSWDDCQEFIARLNEMTGQKFRLPSEAEWEFAARGGNLSHGYKYAGSNNINEVAWLENRGLGDTFARTKAPNELGLYGMSGSMWEWCQDWFGPYSSEPLVNPKGPESGTERVIRGGCRGALDPIYMRVTCRNSGEPDDELYAGIGLRLVME